MIQTDTYTRLPAACAVCGSADGLGPRIVTRVYTPTWVYLGLFAGLLPALILALIFQVTHKLRLKVCPRCGKRLAWAGAVHWLAVLGSLGLIFAAIVVGILNESWLLFFGVFGLAVALAIASGRFHSRANPRYTIFTKDEVEIEIPGHGKYVVIPDWSLVEAFAQSREREKR